MLGRKVKTSDTKKREQPDIKSIMKQLDPIRHKIKKARGGYHQEVYNEMAAALPIALALSSNRKLKKKFLNKVASQRSPGGVPINIVTEVMVYVMDATSESGRKLAWRRGRVIEFLHFQGIKIKKIVAEIKARGGVNAVLKQATEQDPRRKEESEKNQTSGQKAKALLAKTGDEQDQHETDGVNATSAAAKRQNDGFVIMPVLIKLSDRDIIFELPAKSRVKIYATCGSPIKATKVRKLKPGTSTREEEAGWD